MNQRQRDILLKVVKVYIETAEPVGSKHLLVMEKMGFSSATVRSEMAELEKKKLLAKLHTSGGRVPTAKGLRAYLDMAIDPKSLQVKSVPYAMYFGSRSDAVLYRVVRILADKTDAVAFFNLPDGKFYYQGLANLLAKTDISNSQLITWIKMLENGGKLIEFLDGLDLKDQIYVGLDRENKIPELKNAALVAVKYELLPGFSGYLGVLGGLQMGYLRNIFLLKKIMEDLGLQRYVVNLPAEEVYLLEQE